MPRVDDRRVLNGILWRFRTGSPWAEGRFAPDALAFFMPHGDRAGENWSRFRAELDVRLSGPEALERAAAGANATFCMFRQALSAD